MSDFMTQLAENVIVKEAIERAMRQGVASGLAGRDLAANVAKEAQRGLVFNRAFGRVTRAMPGFAWHLTGAALGHAIERNIDSVLPDLDGVNGVKEARFLLKKLAPTLAIGLGEGIADASELTTRWATQVDTKMDELQTDASLPGTARTGKYDLVYVCPDHRLAGYILSVALDARGNVRQYPDGQPIILDHVYNHFDHLSVQAGNGHLPLQGPFELSTALSMLQTIPGSTGGNLGDVLDELKRQNRHLHDAVGREGREFMRVLSATKSQLDAHDRALGEDFIKDIASEAGAVHMIKHLAEVYLPLVQGGRFTRADYAEIIEVFDDWLGAELTLWSKFKVWFVRTRRALQANPQAVPTGARWAFSLSAIFIAMVLFVGLPGLAWWTIQTYISGFFGTNDVTAFWNIMAASVLTVVFAWIMGFANQAVQLVFGWWRDTDKEGGLKTISRAVWYAASYLAFFGGMAHYSVQAHGLPGLFAMVIMVFVGIGPLIAHMQTLSGLGWLYTRKGVQFLARSGTILLATAIVWAIWNFLSEAFLPGTAGADVTNITTSVWSDVVAPAAQYAITIVKVLLTAVLVLGVAIFGSRALHNSGAGFMPKVAVWGVLFLALFMLWRPTGSERVQALKDEITTTQQLIPLEAQRTQLRQQLGAARGTPPAVATGRGLSKSSGASKPAGSLCKDLPASMAAMSGCK